MAWPLMRCSASSVACAVENLIIVSCWQTFWACPSSPSPSLRTLLSMQFIVGAWRAAPSGIM
eukprot:1381780-Pyramimonas_sp.AAC.1